MLFAWRNSRHLAPFGTAGFTLKPASNTGGKRQLGFEALTTESECIVPYTANDATRRFFRAVLFKLALYHPAPTPGEIYTEPLCQMRLPNR